MDFGVHFDTIFSDVRQLIHYSKLAEQYGLKVWVADESYRRETFTVMAAIAAQTKLHSLGCNVTHPYGRSPIILGAVAATVARLMEEREFVFGLGSGGGTLRLHIPIKITSAAIELLQVIRRMFDGEALTFDDYPVLSEMYRLRRGIPIFPLDP